jgi:hypothetical protein
MAERPEYRRPRTAGRATSAGWLFRHWRSVTTAY